MANLTAFRSQNSATFIIPRSAIWQLFCRSTHSNNAVDATLTFGQPLAAKSHYPSRSTTERPQSSRGSRASKLNSKHASSPRLWSPRTSCMPMMMTTTMMNDDASASSTFVAELLVAKDKGQRAKIQAQAVRECPSTGAKTGNVQGGSLYPLV